LLQTIQKILAALLFFAATAAITWLLYVLFFSSPPAEERYWDWDATITFVWYDASERPARGGALLPRRVLRTL
jgi:hypothetical protein